MKLCGTYASGTTYNIGDVVKGPDGLFYHKKTNAAAGTPVYDTDAWEMKNPNTADILDLMTGLLDSLTTLNPNPKELVLASSSSSSTKKFKITIIDNGTISGSEIS